MFVRFIGCSIGSEVVVRFLLPQSFVAAQVETAVRDCGPFYHLGFWREGGGVQ